MVHNTTSRFADYLVKGVRESPWAKASVDETPPSRCLRRAAPGDEHERKVGTLQTCQGCTCIFLAQRYEQLVDCSRVNRAKQSSSTKATEL